MMRANWRRRKLFSSPTCFSLEEQTTKRSFNQYSNSKNSEREECDKIKWPLDNNKYKPMKDQKSNLTLKLKCCALVFFLMLLMVSHQTQLINLTTQQNVLLAEAKPSNKLENPQDFDETIGASSVSSGGSEAEEEEEEEEEREHEKKMKNLDQFLATCKTKQVLLKGYTSIPCNVDKELAPESVQMVWVKLKRNRISSKDQDGMRDGKQDEVQIISLNNKVIAKEGRFMAEPFGVSGRSLIIYPIEYQDNDAYFLCQITILPEKQNTSTSETSRKTAHAHQGPHFITGAKLDVLISPKIVETETSKGVVLASEYEPLTLRCKVMSKPASQITWRREDGKKLDGFTEQRFKHHQIQQQATGAQKMLSHDSSELHFSNFTRNMTGFYLCIASNGIRSGVSQRMGVEAVECGLHKNESCNPIETSQAPSSGRNKTISPQLARQEQLNGERNRESSLQEQQEQKGSTDKSQQQQRRSNQQRTNGGKTSRIIGIGQRRAKSNNTESRPSNCASSSLISSSGIRLLVVILLTNLAVCELATTRGKIEHH